MRFKIIIDIYLSRYHSEKHILLTIKVSGINTELFFDDIFDWINVPFSFPTNCHLKRTHLTQTNNQFYRPNQSHSEFSIWNGFWEEKCIAKVVVKWISNSCNKLSSKTTDRKPWYARKKCEKNQVDLIHSQCPFPPPNLPITNQPIFTEPTSIPLWIRQRVDVIYDNVVFHT